MTAGLGVTVLAAATVGLAWLVATRATSRLPLVSVVAVVGLGLAGMVHLGVGPGADTTDDPLRALRDLPTFHVLEEGDTSDDAVAGLVLVGAVAADGPIASDRVLDWAGAGAGGTAPVALRVDAADVLGGGLAVGDTVTADADGVEWCGLVVGTAPVAGPAQPGAGEVAARHVVTLMVPQDMRSRVRTTSGSPPGLLRTTCRP